MPPRPYMPQWRVLVPYNKMKRALPSMLNLEMLIISSVTFRSQVFNFSARKEHSFNLKTNKEK